MATTHPALILRDGTTVRVRLCTPEDAAALGAFLKRVRGQAGGDDTLRERVGSSLSVEDLCDCTVPDQRLTMLALRTVDGEARVVGSAGYIVAEDGSADIGFGVDEDFRGLGLATALVERIAHAAAHHGVRHLTVRVARSNEPVLEVLRRSGYAVGAREDGGTVAVDLASAPYGAARERTELRDRLAAAASMRPFFHPEAVAVVGASRDEDSLGFLTLHGLVMNRFHGPVYAVNPKASSVGGLSLIHI